MAITPIDIQQQQFKTRPLGYEKAGVDQFLEMIAEDMESLARQNQELREELARARTALEEFRARETTLKETLITSQGMAEEIKANARRDADMAISEARLKAEKIVRDAEERRIQLIGEVQEVKRQKVSFEAGLRALVESHLRLLDMDVLQVHGGEGGRMLEEPLPFAEQGAAAKERRDEKD